MSFKKILFGCLALGMLASCSNELPSEDNKILERETTTYVKISLLSPGSGTRADETGVNEPGFEYGSDDENKVEKILLTFFDAGRNYVGNSLITIDEKDGTVDVETGTSNTVEKVMTFVKPVTLPENSNYPCYVVAYVNPTSEFEDLATDKLEDNMKIIRNRNSVSPATANSPTGARTMNNSVYFDNRTGYVRYATIVNFQNQFFDTEEKAKNATGDAVIEITVERIEAKVRLTNELSNLKNNISDFKTDITDKDLGTAKYKLTFIPEAWFVNGTEKRTFLIKNYRSKTQNILSDNYNETDYGLNLSALKTAFNVGEPTDNRANNVNNPEYLRSYWAIDPTYFTSANTGTGKDLYPDVSYDVKYGNVNPNAIEYPLLYRSYTDVLSDYNAAKSTPYMTFENKIKKCEYVLENTMSYPTLQSSDAMAAMTSVVLLGYYNIKDAAGNIVFDGKVTPDKNKAFYVRHEADDNKYVFLNDNELKDYFIERGGSTLFVKTIDKEGNELEKETYEPLRAAHLRDERYGVSHSDFNVVYPSSTLTNGKKMSEQWRTMQLVKNKDGKFNENIFIYDSELDSGNGGYRNLNSTDAKDEQLINARLYSTYGVVEKFQSGRAKFNVPLKHIWNPNFTDNKFDAKTVHLGDYGVVRNHIYDLTINEIKGLGSGIGDIDQPIVPPTENDQYYIKTRLKILKWRVVGQSVTL